jgi:gluconokinase
MSTSSLRLIVMGVSGCGKSTMAAALGERLGLHMVDGDDLHLPESVAKMRAGIALEDADRWPWLDRIGDYLTQPHPQGRVVACSALKRVYRDFDLIEQRMRQRPGHYMPAGLLDSQFRTLEKPQADEADVIRLPITEPVQDMVAQALTALQARTASRLHPAL